MSETVYNALSGTQAVTCEVGPGTYGRLRSEHRFALATDLKQGDVIYLSCHIALKSVTGLMRAGFEPKINGQYAECWLVNPTGDFDGIITESYTVSADVPAGTNLLQDSAYIQPNHGKTFTVADGGYARIDHLMMSIGQPAAWAPAEGETLTADGGGGMTDNLLIGVKPSIAQGVTESDGVITSSVQTGNWYDIAQWWLPTPTQALAENQTMHLGFSAKWHDAAATTGTAWASLRYEDAAGNMNTADAQIKGITTEWQRFSLSVVVPSGMRIADFHISANQLDAAYDMTNPVLSYGSPVILSMSEITAANVKDGKSPTVSVSKSGTVTTIVVTNADGSKTTQTVNDGVNGTPGAKGADGRTPYFHVKYSNDGGKTFTANSGETAGTYIGTCTDYNSADPTTVGSYTWARIKGDTGATGATGDTGKGATSIIEQYYLSTSSTTQAGGSWSTTQPTWSSGKYIWTKSHITWTDGTTTDTTPVLAGGLNSANQNAFNANNTANNANNTANSAKILANSAQSTADGKNKVIYSTSDPSSTSGYKAGDTWFNRSTGGIWQFNGSAWAVHQVGTVSIQNGAITADKIVSNAITADKIAASAVTADKIASRTITSNNIKAGAITTNDLATDAIKSKNYVAPSRSTSPYSSAGSFFDLSNGNIQTPSFGVRTTYSSSDPADDQGNAFINGRIVAQSGQIGRNSTNYWAIGNSVDYNANESASIVGHGTAYIQSGNWQISNNSINTQSYNSSNSITYPHYNGHYYDYGMKVPDLDPSASGYNDASGVWLYVRRSASDKIPTVYSDWNYLFRVDKDGTIYENGVKLSDRYASIADVGSAYLSTKNGGTVNGNVTITGNLTATASNAKQVANALTVNGKTFNGSAAVNVGTIGVEYGGTGRTSWTSGTLLYASGSTVLSSLGAGANGSFLISHGNGAAPVWTDPSNLTVGNANHVYASGIRWGNQSIAGDVSPIDAAMHDGMASNVLSFANPSGITVEYSNNGGSTWTAYPATDANKITLVTRARGIPATRWHLGNKTTAQSSNADQLRITFDARSMGVYCAAKFLMMNISSGGANNLSVKIETANSQSLTTFTTMGTYPLAGWSGWNSIPWLLDAFGTNGRDNQPVIARMTFSFSGYNSGWESKTSCCVYNILMFATNKWVTPSNYATSGHLYQMDTSQNAYFPAQIKASAFNGNASTATKLATARTISLSGAITGSGTFDGSNNLAITTSVGNLSYLPLSGGTVTGNLTVNGTITGHLSGNASTATAWQTARTLTVGNTGKSVNGSSNVSWSKAEISGDATNTANGWMSAADKKKLDSITVSQIGMVGANSIVGAGDVKVTITNGIATVEHANKSITAGTVSGGSGTLSNGGSFTIPKVTYDAYGHITGTGTTSVILPMITSISGNAATATKLASARTISLSGAITGSGTFDGSNNLAITTSVGNLSYLPLSGGTITGNLKVNGTITGNLSGNASTATKATQDGNGSVISSTYLKLAGGTMVSGAKINFVSNSSTVSDAINRGSSINVEGNGSAYSGWISGNTKLGRMAIATNPGNDENLYFAYNNDGSKPTGVMTWNGTKGTLKTKEYSVDDVCIIQSDSNLKCINFVFE